MKKNSRIGLLAAGLAAVACALDDRQLSPATVGVNGPGDLHDSGAGGAPEGAGGAPSPSDLVDGCADLDTDGVGDCTTNIAQNPSFTSDIDGWGATGSVGWTWDAKNALDDTPSGSGKLSAQTPRASAVQCVTLRGEQLVIVYANVFVETPEDTSAANRAELAVSFFPTADCSGPSDRFFETTSSTVTGQWTMVHAGQLSTASTASLSVALTALKADDAAEIVVYFDNVMVKVQATE